VLERFKGFWPSCAVLLAAVSCGPKVVVAKLATPAAPAPAATTATPRIEPRATARPPASPTPAPTVTASPAPAARPAAPRETETPAPTNTAAAPKASPTRTAPAPPVTATQTFTSPPTATPTPAAATSIPSAPPTASPTPQRTATPATRPSPPATSRPTAAPASPPPPPSAAASLPGEWEFRADAGKGIIAGTLKFRSTPAGLAGTYTGLHGNTTELSNLHTTGAGVSFDLVTPTAVWHLDGTLSGDSIDGTFQTAERVIRWTAVRKL